LGEDVFADAPGAPSLTVIVDFHLYEHAAILALTNWHSNRK
jgi:hypothetical protein